MQKYVIIQIVKYFISIGGVFVDNKEKDFKELEGEELKDVAGGIDQGHIGGAGGKNRCKCVNGTWVQQCLSPNWVDVGGPRIASDGSQIQHRICLNCGAEAQFELYSDGKWRIARTKDNSKFSGTWKTKFDGYDD